MKSSIITNYTDVTFLATIQSNLRSCNSFCFSVSFIKKAGLDLLKNDIAAAIDRDNGIGTLNTTEYTHLKKLYISGLDDGYSYRNYNNMYYTGCQSVIRSKGSFVINEAQFNAAKAYAKANSDSEIFRGISGFENVAWDESSESWVDIFKYKVNSIYKVFDATGNEISISDTDYTDGECTSIVYSTIN